MINNLKIFESNTSHGPMTLEREFYSAILSKEDIEEDFGKRLDKLAVEENFNANIVAFPRQNDIYEEEIGSYINIDQSTKNILPRKKGIFMPCDIVMTNANTSGITLAAPTCDMPVLIIEDEKNKAIAIANCSKKNINEKLPFYVVSALKKEYNSSPSDLKVYISSCASVETFVLKEYPIWAIDKDVWTGAILKDEKGKYHVNLRFAILKQLIQAGIPASNIKSNMTDTIVGKTPELYSEYAYNYGRENKHGKYLVGAFYEDRNVKIRIKSKK